MCCVFVSVLSFFFFLKITCYHSHMNICLLVSKTFQTMYCNDKISLSHNSPWPGCIICDYSRIVGQRVKQWWSWWATFHFWKKKRSLSSFSLEKEMVDWDAHLCWKKTFCLHIFISYADSWGGSWKTFIAGFFFLHFLCIFLLSIQYYHENNTK